MRHVLHVLHVYCTCLLLWEGRGVSGEGREKRSVIYPTGSGMGLFLAVAFPVDLPDYEISLSYNFEANYLLPTNYTELALGPMPPDITTARHARGLNRARLYSGIEERLQSEGLVGRSCLLLAICQAAADPVRHSGLLGQLLHILLTPSASEAEQMSAEYSAAEELGLQGDRESCTRQYGDCHIDVLELISVWEHAE